ncbi:hypothetical protein PENTCL1PPCAC_28916, partial [Pristionchus entomophagus]
QMHPHSSTPAYQRRDGVLEKVFQFIGMGSFFESWRGGELDMWLESRFPTHLKPHVNMIVVGTAVTGAVIGFLLFYCFFSFKSRKRAAGYRRLSDASVMASLSKEIGEDEEGESEDENTPLRILQGRFNKDLISNLHKFNKENGELIRLGDANEEEEDSEYDEDEDEPPELEIEEIEESGEAADSKQDGKTNEDEKSTRGEAAMIEKLGTLHGKLATAQIRKESMKMKKRMSDNEREEEARIRAQQLEAIMELMKADKDKFGENSEELLLDQMESLYNI